MHLARLGRLVQRFAVGIVLTSAAAAILLRAYSFTEYVLIAALPGLILLGWGFLGHFVTLDDDMPGEWSNPEGDRSIWYMSLMGLLVKGLLFIGMLLIAF